MPKLTTLHQYFKSTNGERITIEIRIFAVHQAAKSFLEQSVDTMEQISAIIVDDLIHPAFLQILLNMTQFKSFPYIYVEEIILFQMNLRMLNLGSAALPLSPGRSPVGFRMGTI